MRDISEVNDTRGILHQRIHPTYVRAAVAFGPQTSSCFKPGDADPSISCSGNGFVKDKRHLLPPGF